MKYCNHCKTEKPIFDFVKSKESKSGYRAICKECKNGQSRALKEKIEAKETKSKHALTATQKKYLGATEWKRREREPNEAPGRLYTPTESYVPSKNDFYRNDGHKHLKSRGDRC